MESEVKIGVYVKLNSNKEIVEINSDIFIQDLTDWIKIDDGYGSKYARAQVEYFDKPLINDNRKYNYKYINSEVVEA